MFREIYQKWKTGEILSGYRRKSFRTETPAISEVSSIVYVPHASKSPRLHSKNRVYLNRDLPTLPNERESKMSVMSLESGPAKTSDDEEKG